MAGKRVLRRRRRDGGAPASLEARNRGAVLSRLAAIAVARVEMAQRRLSDYRRRRALFVCVQRLCPAHRSYRRLLLTTSATLGVTGGFLAGLRISSWN